jgi:hypothetical protein
MDKDIKILTNLLNSLMKMRVHYMSIVPTSSLIQQIDIQIELTFSKIKKLNK